MNKLATPLLIVLSLVLIVLLKMGFIFLLIAMLPGITAYYTDHDHGKPTFKTVFTCNLAAAFPFLMPMMMAGITFRHYDSYTVMADLHVWMVVFGGAAAGWCIIYICGFMARFFIAALYEYNAVSLERFQKRLVEEWGEDIIAKNDIPQRN